MESRSANNSDNQTTETTAVVPKESQSAANDTAVFEKECREIEKPASLGHQLLKFATSESIEIVRLSSLFLFMYYKKGTYDTAIYCSSAAAGGLAVFDGIRLWRELGRQGKIQAVKNKLAKRLKRDEISLDPQTIPEEGISNSFIIVLYFLLFLRLLASILNAVIRRVSYDSKDENLKEPWPYIILEVLAFSIRLGMRILSECYIAPRTTALKEDYHTRRGAYLALTQYKASKENASDVANSATTEGKLPDEALAAAEEMPGPNGEVLSQPAGPT